VYMHACMHVISSYIQYELVHESSEDFSAWLPRRLCVCCVLGTFAIDASNRDPSHLGLGLG
jgi:hypothetical protein